MPLSSSAWSSTLFGLLVSNGFMPTAEKLQDFCDAISMGSYLSIVGRPFSTLDTGSITGVGVGSGSGLIGVVAQSIKGMIIAMAGSVPMGSPSILDLADGVANALVIEISKATLTSSHAPVFLGSANIVPGTIPAIFSGMIMAQGVSKGMIGPMWPVIANAIETACTVGFLTATGVLSISGAVVAVPPGPVPGAGPGMGVIS